MSEAQRCTCGRVIPIPVPIEADRRQYVVETNLVGESVMWEVSYWDPGWTNRWADLFRKSTRHYEGVVRGIVDSVHGPELIVQLSNTNGLAQVALSEVVLRSPV